MIKFKPSFRLTQCCRSRGFTMIELMIAVTVLAILTAVALPFYGSFIAGQRIKTASFDMISQLTLVRSEAIKRNSTVTIAPATGGIDWKSGWTVVTAGGTTLSQQAALTGLSIDCWLGTTATACPAKIEYIYTGKLLSPTPSPSFRIFSTSHSTSANTRCIGIDLGGRPYSKKGDC